MNDERIIPVPTALIQWAYEPESEDVSRFNDGYDAARRWVKMQIDYAVSKASKPAHDVASAPEWWKIERSFDVLPHPCVDGKSHQPTIKIVLPACAPDDMAAFDVRDQIAETVRKLLAAAPKAVCPKCFDLTGCPSCAPAV